VTVVEERTAATARTTLGYQPALDGLRGLALVAIVVYHSGLGWAPGAFLSVSTFFTLSGFLITALLLVEHDRHGAISLRAFWGRRLRRLLPAALAAIAAIVIASIWLADTTQLVRLRADALSALGYVANWRFIAAGDTYGATFASPSPFTHFWTLAIEEQFYVVLPLVVVGTLRWGRGSKRRLGWVLAGVMAASIAWANVLVSSGASNNRLYFGTDVRAAELLAGALLAVWWMRRPRELSPTASRVVSVASVAALAAMLGLWFTADLNQIGYYRGGLAAYSLLTLLVILGALQPAGPIRRLLSWKGVVWVGTVSYGAYLVHYPILIWLQSHTRLGPWSRLIIGLPLTLVIAGLSARLLEGPIRRGERFRGLTVILIVTGAVRPVSPLDLQAAANWQKYLKETAAQNASNAPRVAVFGDSTALMTSQGLSNLSRTEPDTFVQHGGWADLGCGLMTHVSRLTQGTELTVPKNCQTWLARWDLASAQKPSDIAVIQVGPWEVVDQRLHPGGPLVSIDDSTTLDGQIADRLKAGIDSLLKNNSYVVVLSAPDIDMGRIDGRSPNTPYPESDPARMAHFRQIERQVVAGNPRVKLIDLASWLAARPDERKLRPDGVHFTPTSTMVVARWLAPQLLDIFHQLSHATSTQVPKS
jgi:peptidoglycan/LPS O-acetylase OafA/YrhL